MFTLKVDSDLELQLFQPHHADELFWMVDSNREHLRRWLPWVDGMHSVLQYPTIIQMWLRQFSENNGYNLGIRYRGTLAGTISLHGMDWRNAQCSMGYYLSENMQGKGIMTRAAQAIINHAFFELGLNRIEIRCGRDNLKSQAIPVRLGFQFEGIIHDGELINAVFHDLLVYSMLSRQWFSNKMI
jgi:ribosomal-protein-serine acetyltransferase